MRHSWRLIIGLVLAFLVGIGAPLSPLAERECEAAAGKKSKNSSKKSKARRGKKKFKKSKRKSRRARARRAARRNQRRKRARRKSARKRRVSRRTVRTAGTTWNEKGWKLVSYGHSKKKNVSVARWLAPASLVRDVPTSEGFVASLVVEVSLVEREGATKPYVGRVVWRGFSERGGRGDIVFHTWSPFHNGTGARPPNHRGKRLTYMFERFVRPGDIRATRRQSSARRNAARDLVPF